MAPDFIWLNHPISPRRQQPIPAHEHRTETPRRLAVVVRQPECGRPIPGRELAALGRRGQPGGVGGDRHIAGGDAGPGIRVQTARQRLAIGRRVASRNGSTVRAPQRKQQRQAGIFAHGLADEAGRGELVGCRAGRRGRCDRRAGQDSVVLAGKRLGQQRLDLVVAGRVERAAEAGNDVFQFIRHAIQPAGGDDGSQFPGGRGAVMEQAIRRIDLLH